MCLKGKNEVEACKSIIQCFTGTLLRWWETKTSPALVTIMENEILKEEGGDIIHNPDGSPQSNMIGALASFILQHWCGGELEHENKHEMILMNLKCYKMSQYEDIHRDWIQRIYQVKHRKNILWK